MKRFRLEVVPDAEHPDEREHDFEEKDVLIGVVKVPTPPDSGQLAGMDAEEVMRIATRILPKLTAAKPGDVVELEDEDFSLVLRKVNKYRWGLATAQVAGFISKMRAVTDTVPDEAAAATAPAAEPEVG